MQLKLMYKANFSGCQFDDTEPKHFPNQPQFCEFDVPTGRN